MHPTMELGWRRVVPTVTLDLFRTLARCEDIMIISDYEAVSIFHSTNHYTFSIPHVLQFLLATGGPNVSC